MKKILIIIAAFITTVTLTGCVKDYQVASQSFYGYLDTISTITVEYKNKDITTEKVNADFNHVTNMLLEIEKTYSPAVTINMMVAGITESLLMELNRKSGKTDGFGNKQLTTVNDAFLEILDQAIKLANETNRGFEPTIGSLTSLWNISELTEYCNPNSFGYDPGYEGCLIPTEEAIENAKALVDYTKIEIDRVNKTVYLPVEGMRLDLGAIAKGFAADEIIDYLKEEGYSYIMVNLGGNLIMSGKSVLYKNRCRGSIVEMQIANPMQTVDCSTSTIMSIEKTDISLVTSGISERYILVDNKIYHHLLSAETGYPFDNEIVTVSIMAKSSCVADGLATGIYSLGLTDGIEYIKNSPNYSAVFITTDWKIYVVGDIKYSLSKDIGKYFEVIKVK